MRALITGAAGQLGQELAAILPRAQLVDRAALDITDEERVWEVLTAQRLDVVFHCAALTDVDACERDPASAYRVNALGTRNLATVCGALGIYLIAISTDYVFDGRRRVNLEDAEPRPLSVYGRSKLVGEVAVREHCSQYAVVRTAWLYGAGRRNFVRTVLRRAVMGEPLAMVQHEVSSPTWARDLAMALAQLARRRGVGTFHITNAGTASRYEWARTILALAGLNPELVMPVAEYPLPARRPAYSALANVRARALGIQLRPWREALSVFLETDPDVQSLLAESVRTAV
jgi:dTDP-4-dehydrorhamnose reductase